jgi:hypothetical protein
MNFLKSAWIVVAVGAFLSAQAQEEATYDHESLTTVEGAVYREIFIVGSDATGLTFRHRGGIAKVGYASLSDSYRALYEAVEELPATESAPAEESVPAPVVAASPLSFAGGQPVVVIARQQLRIPLSRSVWEGACSPVYLNWPVAWADHREVLRLADPCWRARSVRDFLYFSGLSSPCRIW